MIDIVVVGAHLQGQPLNSQLTERDAELTESTRTAERYRMYRLRTNPPKPGLVRVDEHGSSFDVEIWRMSETAFAQFVDGIPAPMVIGRVLLADGRDIAGFLVEPYALDEADDISDYDGWRDFLNSQRGEPTPSA